ncbi:MAG: type IV pilus assembly protein PilM [Candidatus Niyogibacteria bacterium]|nr:MAG: type IV pilus assembly protein PilM [Candidatus Niyogibacteria bacterium]
MLHLSKFFPPPSYLDFPITGLDISDRSIKYVELKKNGAGLRLKRAGKRNLPSGLILAGEIKKPDELAANLAEFLKPLGVDHVVAALPEERAYISVMSLPKMEKNQIREAVESGLPEKIPLPAGESVFDFEFLKPAAAAVDGVKINDNQVPHQDVVVYAFSKTMVQSYLDVYLSAGLYPVSFAMETAALSRALMPESHENPPTMIVDFGKTRTTFVIIAGGLVRFSSTVNVAGESLDQAIAKSLNIPVNAAEKTKKENGMSRASENRAVFESILPVIAAVSDEIERHILFWNTHAEHVHQSEPQISKVILSGGDSNLIGFSEYLAAKLGLSVELGNPWVNVAPFEKYIPEITFNESLALGSAIGLGLMALDTN